MDVTSCRNIVVSGKLYSRIACLIKSSVPNGNPSLGRPLIKLQKKDGRIDKNCVFQWLWPSKPTTLKRCYKCFRGKKRTSRVITYTDNFRVGISSKERIRFYGAVYMGPSCWGSLTRRDQTYCNKCVLKKFSFTLKESQPYQAGSGYSPPGISPRRLTLLLM